MKITLMASGGFAYIPALSKPVVIDTAQLDPQTCNQLESCVRDVRFFDQPARPDAPARGAADYRTYTITVQDGPRIHTVQVIDPIKDVNLQRLVSILQATASLSSR
jgi:hypothetical protein